MRIVELQMQDFFKMPDTSLHGYLARVKSGYANEIRTPWYTGRKLSSLLHDWIRNLKSLKSTWPSLYDFEIDLSKKVGPMSIMKPLSERMDDIESYYASILLDASPISEEAIARELSEFGINHSIRLRDRSRTINNMKLSTNSGSPYFTKRKRLVDKGLEFEMSLDPLGKWQYTINEGNDLIIENFKPCAIIGWRGQEGGPEPDDVKQRVVWMFPFAVNVFELQVYQPLIQALQRPRPSDGTTPYVPAWTGLRSVEECVTRMFDSKPRDDYIVCTDFSKFDQHFNPRMQACAYSILENMLTDSQASQDWLHGVFPIKYAIPMCIADGLFTVGGHGMASGSGGTNADETLTHRALQHEAAIMNNTELNEYSQCLGDDGVLTYPGITVEQVVETYSRHGQEMNLDKQYASKDDLVYLRRWYHDEYRDSAGRCMGVYSTCRALGRLAEQERFIDPRKWSREMVALRQLSILENVKNHPLREQFVEWSIKGDKYAFGLDIPGFFDKLGAWAEEAKDEIPNMLGYTRSLEYDATGIGINDWWIVRYLRSRA